MHKKESFIAKDDLLDEGILMKYLRGDLSGAEAYRLEAALDENPFLRDALDGLDGLDEAEIHTTVLLLQRQLKKHIGNRKKSGLKPLKPKLLLWVSVLVVLLLVFVAWWVIVLAGK